MSRRVYEIARESGLSTKEVIARLNDAGIEVKSHLAVVEDSLYEKVFGDDPNGAAPNGRPEVQGVKPLPSTNQPRGKRLLPSKTLAQIVVAALVFVLAASLGATGALILRADLRSSLLTEEPRAQDKQDVGSRPQEKDAAAQPEADASQQSDAEYVASVGDIQANAVEAFLDSHDKLLRYDAISADDVEKVRANQAALRGLVAQVDDLDPPQRYAEQYEVFRSAINELDEAVQVAYDVVADPITATKADFDEYDRHAQEGTSRLQRSNEILGRNYKTIEGLQEISPL